MKFSIVYLFLFASLSAFAKEKITISKSGESCTNGYYSVVETHETGGLFSSEKHSLVCSGSGNEKALWTMVPYAAVQNDMALIEANIAKGIFTGSIKIDGRTISWSGTTVSHYVMEVEIG